MTEFKGIHYVDDEISDDPGYSPATPLTVRVDTMWSEREYENLADDYLTFTPEEARLMIAALQDALAKRDLWLLDNPNGLADLKVKAEREEAGYAEDGSVVKGWYFNQGWYPDLAEDNEWMLGNIQQGARYTNNEDPEVAALFRH